MSLSIRQKQIVSFFLCLILAVAVVGVTKVVWRVGVVYAQESVEAEESTEPADNADCDSNNEVCLKNPLTGSTTSVHPILIFSVIIKTFLGMVGSLSLLIFVAGGLMWLTSAGNPEKIKKGRDTLIWAVLGVIVTFASYTILKFVISALSGF